MSQNIYSAFFGNLSVRVAPGDLKKLCADYGFETVSEYVSRQGYQDGTTFGFARFEGKESRDAAVSTLNGIFYYGKHIKVQVSNQPLPEFVVTRAAPASAAPGGQATAKFKEKGIEPQVGENAASLLLSDDTTVWPKPGDPPVNQHGGAAMPSEQTLKSREEQAAAATAGRSTAASSNVTYAGAVSGPAQSDAINGADALANDFGKVRVSESYAVPKQQWEVQPNHEKAASISAQGGTQPRPPPGVTSGQSQNAVPSYLEGLPRRFPPEVVQSYIRYGITPDMSPQEVFKTTSVMLMMDLPLTFIQSSFSRLWTMSEDLSSVDHTEAYPRVGMHSPESMRVPHPQEQRAQQFDSGRQPSQDGSQ